MKFVLTRKFGSEFPAARQFRLVGGGFTANFGNAMSEFDGLGKRGGESSPAFLKREEA